MRAWHRQLAHTEARLFAAMAAVARASAVEAGLPSDELDEYAADEVRAALMWTRRRATDQVALGWDLVRDWPQVWTALDQGRIDTAKAVVILNGVSGLSREAATDVVERALVEAPGKTTGQLGARIAKWAIAADPEAARRRYERAVETRRVVSEMESTGAANVYGLDLPVDRVAAAMADVNRLARNAKSKDDPRSIDQVRADVFLDLLTGRLHGSGNGGGDGRGGVVEVRVDLATLAGLSEAPGDLMGFGPVIADVARQVADAQRDAEWRIVATDPASGGVLWDGTTKRRPTTDQRRYVAARYPTCTFPGCRMPATACDIDHRHRYTDTGLTITEDLGPLCRHDHIGKDSRGWRVELIALGTLQWTSPLGHKYVVQPNAP
jgi:Domain of unknown function (DUF222)